MLESFAALFLFTTLLQVNAYPTTNNDTYWKLRYEILHSEEKMALGGQTYINADELKANAILLRYKEKEVLEGFAKPATFLPASNFMTVKDKIDNSEVFKMIRKMPKGAVLHVHEFGLVSADYVFNELSYLPDLHICYENDNLFMKFINDTEVSDSCLLISELRKYPDYKDRVDLMIKSMLSMQVDNPDQVYRDVNSAWDKFSSIFMSIGPMLTYRPVFEKYLYQGLLELYEDNVMYVEIRTTLPDLYDLNGTTYSGIEVAEIFKKVSDKFVETHPDFLEFKIIYAPIRNVRAVDCSKYMAIAEDLKNHFPNFVAGFDLVGQEDKGLPLEDFVKHLRHDIPFFFHAGETDWNGLSTDLNLIDAILLKAKRIGHGYAVLKHPLVLSKLKEYNIPIEVNPISNQVLKLVGDLRNHPASFLFANNYPVVVSCDDPGLWGSKGLSYDFYEAFVGIMSLKADLRALKQLAINSINYSSLSKEQQKYALQLWSKKWNTFVKDVIS